MAKYYGSDCTSDCSGHKAGYRYVKRGGRKINPKSPSFSKGMRVAQRHLKNKGVNSRLRK
jgi:hypothetical protein